MIKNNWWIYSRRILSKNVLRERIYSNCLDYFCRERQLPTQEIDQLSEDIVTLIRFWQVRVCSKLCLIYKLRRADLNRGDFYKYPFYPQYHYLFALLCFASFLQVMHSDKKYLMMTGADNEFEIVTSQTCITTVIVPSETIGSLAATLAPTPNDFSKSSSNVWMNTMPMSTSSNTLGKRSNRSKRIVNANVFVKDYIKKRNLILELLAVEIEMLLVRVLDESLYYILFYHCLM